MCYARDRKVIKLRLMRRPREFDPDTAIAGAMQIFWRQGYKATNLPDLLAAMGLTRGSFYKAYGDKQAVFLEALDHYDREVVSRSVETLEDCGGETAVDCLSPLFATKKDGQMGCFICNAMVELAPSSPEVAAKTEAMAGRLRGAIAGVLERFGAREVEETADLILHLYFGHQAMGRSSAPERDWPRRLGQLVG